MKYHSAFLVVPMFVFSASVMSAVAPTITKVSVTPTSATAGTMFKFSAELNTPLPEGYKVKIDLGKGLASMTGTKTSYSLSRAIYTTGSQTYKVGIYNAKNALQGKVSSGNYSVSSSINNAPTLTLVSGDDTVEQNKVYTLQLKATDSDNNLRSISVDWKDGSKAETQTATNDATLTFTHIYATAGKFELIAIAKDSGAPNLTSTVLSKTIEVVEPPANAYTKVCNNGALDGEEDCPVNPTLGNKPTDWACTKDNKTGLIWEVKTTDGGLRDSAKRYSNYTPEYPKCNWADCEKIYPGKYDSDSNTNGFVFDVNSQGLCGANDWRMPTKSELMGIVKIGVNIYVLAINTDYFPNTQRSTFWSSSPLTSYYRIAWGVIFSGGYSSDSSSSMGNDNYNYVRLVRDTK